MFGWSLPFWKLKWSWSIPVFIVCIILSVRMFIAAFKDAAAPDDDISDGCGILAAMLFCVGIPVSGFLVISDMSSDKEPVFPWASKVLLSFIVMFIMLVIISIHFTDNDDVHRPEDDNPFW